MCCIVNNVCTFETNYTNYIIELIIIKVEIIYPLVPIL